MADSPGSKRTRSAPMQIFLANVGWGGAGMIVLAYMLLSNEKLTAKSFDYQFLNLFGAFLVGISSWVTKNWPSVVLQIVWMGIAGLALLQP